MSVDRPPGPGDAELLDGWERTRSLTRPWRELALLATLEPSSAGDLAALPIGERDRRLLELVIRLRGRRLECETACPACGERLELELDADRLRSLSPPQRAMAIRHRGTRISVRPPTSEDVAASLDSEDPEGVLIRRCTSAGESVVPAALRERVMRAMATLDPAAELLLTAACPSCGARWQVPVDPAALAIEEVARRAGRILREVDQLARAYGWRERDVLELSPQRRQAYIQLSAQ